LLSIFLSEDTRQEGKKLMDGIGDFYKKWIFPVQTTLPTANPVIMYLAITEDWTASVDFSAIGSPFGLAARGGFSIAVDHEAGWLFAASGGGGGSTPVGAFGPGVTITNAPSVEKLLGPSVQTGGSAGAGVGIFAEGVFFSDSDTGESYKGISVSGGAVYPQPLLGSVHGTAEVTKGWHFNPLDAALNFSKWLWLGD
jgi:hypothetical protein